MPVCRYDTCMLVAFLQQLLTFGGFYDEQREFLRVERVQVSDIRNVVTYRSCITCYHVYQAYDNRCHSSLLFTVLTVATDPVPLFKTRTSIAYT
jgi:hypothetical protein